MNFKINDPVWVYKCGWRPIEGTVARTYPPDGVVVESSSYSVGANRGEKDDPNALWVHFCASGFSVFHRPDGIEQMLERMRFDREMMEDYEKEFEKLVEGEKE